MPWFGDPLAARSVFWTRARHEGRRRQARDPFAADFEDTVGPRRRNRRSDVAALERALGAEGYLSPARARRPREVFDGGLEGAVRRFQADHGLAADGWAAPAGPTRRTLARRRDETRAEAARPARLSAEAGAANARTVQAMERTTDLGVMPHLIADAHTTGGPRARVELDDLFGQLRRRDPGHADRLFEAAGAEVARRTGRPLPAALFPSLLAGRGAGDADGEPPAKPTPPPAKPDAPGTPEPGSPKPDDEPEDGEDTGACDDIRDQLEQAESELDQVSNDMEDTQSRVVATRDRIAELDIRLKELRKQEEMAKTSYHRAPPRGFLEGMFVLRVQGLRNQIRAIEMDRDRRSRDVDDLQRRLTELRKRENKLAHSVIKLRVQLEACMGRNR